MQHRADLSEQLTYPSPSTGDRIGLTFIEPASESDLVRRRATVKTWMDWCGGMMGRTPDFMNIHITGFASAHEYFARGGKQFGRNIRGYYEFLRERDLCLTHTLLSPTVDKSKPVQNQPPGVAAAIVKETDAGIVVNGARSVATLAPFANEIAVFPSTYLQNSEEARPYAFAFCVPMATPGLRFICRPSLTETAGPAGRPSVLVADGRDGLRRDLRSRAGAVGESVRRARRRAGQRAVRRDRMHQPAHASVRDQEPGQGRVYAGRGAQHVRCGELARRERAEPARGNDQHRRTGARGDPRRRGRSRSRAAGTVLPNAEPLWTVRLLFPQLYPRLVEIVQMLGSSNLVMMPSLAEFAGERADDVALYCQGVGVSAEQRVRLFRLAWDVSCSSFAGRQTLYERFFSGDPWRLGIARYQGYPIKDSLKQRVWDFIARAGQAPAASAKRD